MSKEKKTLVDVSLEEEIADVEEFTKEYWEPMLKAASTPNSKKEVPTLQPIIEEIIKKRKSYIEALRKLLTNHSSSPNDTMESLIDELVRDFTRVGMGNERSKSEVRRRLQDLLLRDREAQTAALREQIEQLRPLQSSIGEAPGDNAVGSEQRAFGRNNAIDAILSLLPPKQ